MTLPITRPHRQASGDPSDALSGDLIGTSHVLLCASLFYFRLPRAQWRARLAQVAESGYTCVDVYLPWNFHELAPGEWDFSGERDVAAFLDLARDAGLHVIARPGPYICSEWDGGALPAWLTLDPELRVRQNEPRYLAQVERWFDRILPILAARQVDPGGTPSAGSIIAVQLENELDFFDCHDRTGYLSALRDLARAGGIRVPLIACAGQGDLAGATGDVDDVLVACNFYPDDASPAIEAEVRRYADVLAERGLPLLITETNRAHRTLRRMFASGARLIAPYLQSSGWNFGLTPSAGNWGDPGSFMSHAYDFGGYVSATGQPRREYAEARLFARVIAALGDKLATSGTTADLAAGLATDFPSAGSPSALNLTGGGQLIAVPNLGADDGVAHLTLATGAVQVAVPAGQCPLLLVGVPLAGWGFPGTLELASADLVGARQDCAGLVLELASDVPVTVVFSGLGDLDVEGVGDVRVARSVTAVRLDVAGPWEPAPSAVLSTTAGRIVVQVVGRRASATGPTDEPGPTRPALPVAAVRVTPATDLYPRTGLTAPADLPPALEARGVYRGRGRYLASLDATGVDALVIAGASDIVEVSVDGVELATIARFGATDLIDVSACTGRVDLAATVEIWGHSNFDDSRLPALRLGSLRGLGRVWTLESRVDVTSRWTVGGVAQWAGRAPAPERSFGGWSSTRGGAAITYRREVSAASRDAVLHFEGLSVPVRVAVDGGAEVGVYPENPWLAVPGGRTVAIAVTHPHDPGARPVRVSVLGLRPVAGWQLATLTDRDLDWRAREARAGTPAVDLPLTVPAGSDHWLDLELPAAPGGYAVRFEGHQLRLTVWLDGRCLGRVWLEDDHRPVFTGGDPGLLWAPGEWVAGGGRLTILAHGTAGGPEPTLRRIEARPL